MNETQETIVEDLKEVRADIQTLKRCQLTYFTLAVTATGAVLGFAKDTATDLLPLTMLAPLVVILPCWWVFFDKATTITRNFGYLVAAQDRLVASLNVTPIPPLLGFERALMAFRDQEEALRNKPFEVRHRYWDVNWLTNCILSIASILLAATATIRMFILSPGWLPVVFALAVVGAITAACPASTRIVLGDIWNGAVLGGFRGGVRPP